MTSWNEQGETQAIPAVRVAAPPAVDATSEPVVIAHAVTVVLGALVTAGWVSIPNPVIDTVGTVVALALSTLGVILARARVSPVSGGIWGAVQGYVADLVAVELGRLTGPPPVAARRPVEGAHRFTPPGP